MVFAGVLGGCYKPDVANGGYACTPDVPDCPSGFVCVANRCVDANGPLDSGVTPPGEQDFAMSMTSNDLAGVQDLAMNSSTDMAGQVTPPDMAKPVVHDMAQMCTASGSGCTSDDQCCSGSCVLIFIFAGLCA